MSDKRFKHTDIFSEDVLICKGIKDTENNYVYNLIDDSVCELSEKELIDLLNDLNEKNKALELIAEDKLFTRRELEKENEELKDKLDNIRKEVIEIDLFSDEALNHDIIAYREMHDFDNKDCYDIAWAIEKIKKECFL